MRLVSSCLLALIATLEIGAAEEIRKFDQATIEKLGVAIYEQDLRAAAATDVLFAQKIDLEKEGVRGWVISGDAKKMLVRFIREKNGTMEAFYDITFEDRKPAGIWAAADPKLTAAELAQFKARSLAVKNIKRPGSRNYNFVILPDPEGDGMLVYALAATTEPDTILLGGHYRFTVSKDGERIVRSDELFRSFLTLPARPKDLPPGAQPEALFMTTLVSNLPLETHVFLSLLHKVDFMVGTPDRHIWKIHAGKMERVE